MEEKCCSTEILFIVLLLMDQLIS